MSKVNIKQESEILVIGDEEISNLIELFLCEMTEEGLLEYNFKVFYDYKEAVLYSSIESFHKPCLIILTYNYKKYQKDSLLKKIRKIDSFIYVPVVMIVGPYKSEEEVHYFGTKFFFDEEGFYNFLKKLIIDLFNKDIY